MWYNLSMDVKQMQSNLQVIADDLVAQEPRLQNLSVSIKIHLKNIQRGRAKYKTGYISIPLWAVDCGQAYLLYYLIHEICHFMTHNGHSSQFQQDERHYLAKYGLIPVYKRVYVKKLLDFDGQTAYSR